MEIEKTNDYFHFSCPHCDKKYYTLESELTAAPLVTQQQHVFTCTNCKTDFLVECDEIAESRRLNESVHELTTVLLHEVTLENPVDNGQEPQKLQPNVQTEVVFNSELVGESAQVGHFTQAAELKHEKLPLPAFLFSLFRQSLKVKYMPFYLALVCFILGSFFAHMRNAIGLAAVLLLLQMAFSYIFESKA